MPRDWSMRVALLLVSIMAIQTISLGGGTILGVPSQGLVDSEQNGEIDNGRSEKIYVNFQIDALSDLNGASITIYDLAGTLFIFEFDTTGGGGFDAGSRVVLVYEIGTINGTVEEFSSMVDSLAWFDAEVVAENVVKISSVPEGDLLDAWVSSPTEEISISIAQGVDPHVLPEIRELFRVPVIGSGSNSQLLVRHFLASQEGDFVFIGGGWDFERFDTNDCYQADGYAETFIAVFDSSGTCSWVMKIRANIFDAGLINDSIMIFAEAYVDLTILGNDIEYGSWFFGSIGLDGVWRNVFSAPRSDWDSTSMYEIQNDHEWFATLVVEEGMIIHNPWNDLAEGIWGQNDEVSISGCTGSYFAAKITPEGVCIDQFNGSGTRWNFGLTRTGDGKLWNVWGSESHSMTSDFENYSYHQFTPYSGDEDITGIAGEFPLSALGSKIASGSQYCTEGGYESSTYTAISHDKGIFIGSIVNDPDHVPDYCPLGMFLVYHSEMSFEIVELGENTRFSSPCEEGATNCVGVVQFGDGFCLVPGDRWGSGNNGHFEGENGWKERTYWTGVVHGSGGSSTYFSETCFDSNWEIDWTFGHSESLTGNPYCTAETSPSWDVDETILYDPFDDYSEVQGVDGALLRVKVVNYRDCNGGNGVHSYHEIIVQAIDPPSKVDNDNDGIFDLQDHCPGTGFGRVVDELGCAWEQADDDGDGFTNLIESQCDTLTNNSSSTPIDIDGDGTCDYLDNDYDGDGVINSEDAFPGDPTEWGDADGDGIGDNSDEDADGDGLDDSWRDTDEDGYYDHEDAFPYDPNEWSDRDGDGIGDNSDDEPDGVDDDSDGGGAGGDSEDDSGTDTQGDGELGNDDGGMSGNSGSADGANSDATQVDPGIQDEGGSDEVGSDSLWSTACGLVGFFVFIGIGYNRRVNALKSEIRLLRDQLDSPNYRR